MPLTLVGTGTMGRTLARVMRTGTTRLRTLTTTSAVAARVRTKFLRSTIGDYVGRPCGQPLSTAKANTLRGLA